MTFLLDTQRKHTFAWEERSTFLNSLPKEESISPKPELFFFFNPFPPISFIISTTLDSRVLSRIYVFQFWAKEFKFLQVSRGLHSRLSTQPRSNQTRVIETIDVPGWRKHVVSLFSNFPFRCNSSEKGILAYIPILPTSRFSDDA